MRQSAMIAGDVIEDRPRAGQASIDRQWLAERELSDLRPESFAVFGHHLVAAFHGAEGRGEWAERGVLVGLSGRHHGLFTNHAGPPNFLDFTVRVGNNPMSVEELNGHRAPVYDSNTVGEKPTTLRRQRTLGNVARADGDLDAPGCRFRIDHQLPPFLSARRIQPPSLRGDSRPGVFLIPSPNISSSFVVRAARSRARREGLGLVLGGTSSNPGRENAAGCGESAPAVGSWRNIRAQTVMSTFQWAAASQWMWKQWRPSPCPSPCRRGRPCV